jgi:hypothetical protein
MNPVFEGCFVFKNKEMAILSKKGTIKIKTV